MKESKIIKVYRNICSNEWTLREIQDLRKEMTSYRDEVKTLTLKVEQLENTIIKNNRNTEELLYATRFHDTAKDSDWLNIPLSLSSGAIGYNFAYILYRILNDIKPNKILEMGLGQSTKIINEYVKHNKGIEHHIIEHDKNWVDFFKKSTDVSDYTNFHLLNNYKKSYKGSSLNAYKNFKNEFKGMKFNLICIDGPVGVDQEYSRMDILEILPDCLEKQFIILLDDCNRIGEQHTIELLENNLKNNNIKYKSGFQYKGVTDTYICVSEDLEFLCHI